MPFCHSCMTDVESTEKIKRVSYVDKTGIRILEDIEVCSYCLVTGAFDKERNTRATKLDLVNVAHLLLRELKS